MLPGNGEPQAIFLPRQKRQARGGCFTGVFLEGKELRPMAMAQILKEIRWEEVSMGKGWLAMSPKGSEANGY